MTSIEINEEAFEKARLHVENELIWMRDERISILNWANGIVIREKDGSESTVVRMRTQDALRMGIKAYLREMF